MSHFFSEIRSTFRSLARSPGFTLTAILVLTLGQGGYWVGLGAIAGLAGSLVAARLIQHELFGVGSMDGASFALALGLLGAASLLACLVPALRAARVDPSVALRSE